ncbi:hypothetical protein [Pseudotabrizicola sp. 4114]|uniref:hypothetical protein n=1 Tax=Pseudotabrizicola sp. 4114 TaxID=2817731 RepID=UPI002856C64F|nr:hypothetical protein [Pseudorhodobacter sp. 4114]
MTVRGQKRDRILRALDGRRNAVDLAREVGCCPKYVRFVVRSAGRSPDLVPMQGGFIAQIHALRALVNVDRLCLTPEVLAWLAAQTGGGVTIADVIRGVLVDAWAEDLEGGAE